MLPAGFSAHDGIGFIGTAPEKAWIFAAERRVHRLTGKPCPAIIPSTSMASRCHVHGQDGSFPEHDGLCSEFPCPASLCLQRHRVTKRGEGK